MGTLFNESRTLQCPYCAKYISSDATFCKHCSEPISAEMLQAGIEKETENIRQVQIKFYRNSLAIGIVLLIAGAGLFFLNFLSARTGSLNIECLSPILVIAGIGQVLYSLNGLYKERRK